MAREIAVDSAAAASSAAVVEAAAACVRFPWQVSLARADSFSRLGRPVPSDRRLVLAITAASAALRVLPSSTGGDEPSAAAPGAAGRPRRPKVEPPDGGVECGFDVLPLSPAKHVMDHRAGGAADDDLETGLSARFVPTPPPRSLRRLMASGRSPPQLTVPLLAARPPPLPAPPSSGATPHGAPAVAVAAGEPAATQTVAGSMSALGSSGGPALAMSIEVPESTCGSQAASDSVAHSAYLIRLPEKRNEYMLAVPQMGERAQAREATPWWRVFCLPATLPSNVRSVRLEVQREATPRPSPAPHVLSGAPPATKPSDAIAVEASTAVQLTVVKTVPPLGWLLLAYALLASYSSGAVVNVQAAAVAGGSRHIFLRYAWRGMCSTALLALVSVATTAKQQRAGGVWMLASLRGSQWRRLVGAGVALFTNKALFAFTSLSHAALYDSMAPLWLVGGKVVLVAAGYSQQGVPRLDVIGVGLGALGALTCLLDDRIAFTAGALPPTANVGSSPVGLLADAPAVFSGLGSCVYLQLAERLRLEIDPSLFLCIAMAVFTACSLVAAYTLDASPPSLSTDPEVGLFGWAVVALPGRLLSQLWLAAIVDYSGNVGLVAVMKYVPALVVAAAYLLGPLIATAEGVLTGVEPMPGSWTLLGGALTVASTALIAARAQRQQTTVSLSR